MSPVISQIYAEKGPHVSFEVFPPKTQKGLKQIYQTIYHLKSLNPDFLSVTYGAGGTTAEKSLEIASAVQNLANINCVAHFTCVGMDQTQILDLLKTLKSHGIRNVIALRGDPPQGQKSYIPVKNGFAYATQLVSFIRENIAVGILVAGYPEGHKDNPSKDKDFQHLLEKVNAGANGIITQLFFENRFMLEFTEKLKNHHIDIPVVSGIMPISSKINMKRIIELSGVSIPPEVQNALLKYENSPKELDKFGRDFAIEQVENLLKNELNCFHFYTMNRHEQTKQILFALKTNFPNLTF